MKIITAPEVKASSPAIQIEEITSARVRYGGPGSQEAINRHSSRVYKADGRFFTLDRCLSMCPPAFELTYFPVTDAIGALGYEIEIDGQRYFGSGSSWEKAEAKAFEAITDLLQKNPSLVTFIYDEDDEWVKPEKA